MTIYKKVWEKGLAKCIFQNQEGEFCCFLLLYLNENITMKCIFVNRGGKGGGRKLWEGTVSPMEAQTPIHILRRLNSISLIMKRALYAVMWFCL